MTRLLFPGTFRPFTLGHDSVVRRALPLADEIIIAIGTNAQKVKGASPHPIAHGDGSALSLALSADAGERAEAIRRVYRGEPRVRVITYAGLTTDLAEAVSADALLRGVRSVRDFEYERDLADTNRRLQGIETVLLYTLPEHAAISSTVVRELAAYGHDVSMFLPTSLSEPL